MAAERGNGRGGGEAAGEPLDAETSVTQRPCTDRPFDARARDYGNTVRGRLDPALGADTPLEKITTERLNAYREALLAEDDLSRRSVQKILVMLHGILKRAKRRKWIVTNPAEDVERVRVRRSGDFNVLTPTEVAAVARAVPTELDAAIWPLHDLQGYMGHRDIATTMIYVHHVPKVEAADEPQSGGRRGDGTPWERST